MAIGTPAFAASTNIKMIRQYVGAVGPANAAAFLMEMALQTDRVIGLKVAIESADSQSAEFRDYGYLVEEDHNQFSASVSSLENGGTEMVCPSLNVSYLHGNYILDGFFLVKSGGMHQGVISVGLVPVSEAEVRLNPAIRIVSTNVKALKKR